MPTANVTAALRPLSTTYRRLVREELVRRGLPTSGPLNPARRKALEDAVFAVQNELEHRSHRHPQVAVMNAARNGLLDEISVGMDGNETHSRLRWPHVEAVAAVMHSRRGGGRGRPFLPRKSAQDAAATVDVVPIAPDQPRATRSVKHAPKRWIQRETRVREQCGRSSRQRAARKHSGNSRGHAMTRS